MIVAEVKQLAPKAEVYELSQNGKYMIALPEMPTNELVRLGKHLVEHGIQGVLVIANDIKVFGFEEA